MIVKTFVQEAFNNSHLWTSSSLGNDKRLNILVTGTAILSFGIYGYLQACKNLSERTLLAQWEDYTPQFRNLLKAEEILDGKKIFFSKDAKTGKDIFLNSNFILIARGDKSGTLDREYTVFTKDRNTVYGLTVSQHHFDRIIEQNPSQTIQEFSSNSQRFLLLLKCNSEILAFLKNEVKKQYHNQPIHRFDYLRCTYFTSKKVLTVAVLLFAYISFTLHALHTRNTRSIYASKTAARATLFGLGVFLLTYLPQAPHTPKEPIINIGDNGKVTWTQN